MSTIHEIPVIVINERVAESFASILDTSALLALCREIEPKLESLLVDQEESTIDLSWLGKAPKDLERLRETLGRGEVMATVETFGHSVVQETAVPCVWWVSHHDSDNGSQGEFIEIAEVPELLRSDRLSIHRGLAGLRARCCELEKSGQFRT